MPPDPPVTRCISGLRTDGGTRFVLRTTQATWHPEFRRLFNEWRVMPDDRAELAELRRKTVLVTLPLPPVPTERRNVVLPIDSGARERDGRGGYVDGPLDPRRLGFGWSDAGPIAELQRSGELGGLARRIVLYFPDRAYVTFSEREGPDGVYWEVNVQAKARELYEDGLRQWMTRWLGYFGWLCCAHWCLPEDAAACGWTCSQWHLNADFVGLDLDADDQTRFVLAKKGQIERRLDKPDYGHFDQTIYLGQVLSDTRLVIYRKGDQLREAKRVQPEHSMYAPLWRSHGWSPDDGDPTRVELRLRKKGLVYISPSTREIELDFRDPATLLDPLALRKLWAYQMTRRRLVLEGKTRRRRGEIDPRWQVVIGAAKLPAPELRQIPREVARLTLAERMAKFRRQLIQSSIGMAMGNGAKPRGVSDVIAAMRFAADELERAMLAGGVDDLFKPIPGGMRLEDWVDQKLALLSYCEGEAAARYQEFLEATGIDMPSWGTGPPEET